MNKLGIYVHVPFCLQKCRYCDFYSLASCDESVFASYRDALLRHFDAMADAAKEYTVDTVYFGGGTPSLLPLSVVKDILKGLSRSFTIERDAEITLELNPKTADRHKMEGYALAGINRLSIGCQSANDTELQMLGRLHSFFDYCETVSMARDAGIANVSADLMMGLPSQSMESLLSSIDRIAETEPNHISVYGLKIEQGTWFANHRDLLDLPDEDTESEMYLQTVQRLASLGYNQYEISNFAKDGYAARHNLKYWQGMPYLGFGPAAYSCFEGCRYGYSRDLNAYIDCVKRLDFSPIMLDVEHLSEQEIAAEKLMLGLRLTKGICLSDYCFDSEADAFIAQAVKNRLATLKDGVLALTAKGMLVDNYITAELLSHLQ